MPKNKIFNIGPHRITVKPLGVRAGRYSLAIDGHENIARISRTAPGRYNTHIPAAGRADSSVYVGKLEECAVEVALAALTYVQAKAAPKPAPEPPKVPIVRGVTVTAVDRLADNSQHVFWKSRVHGEGEGLTSKTFTGDVSELIGKRADVYFSKDGDNSGLIFAFGEIHEAEEQSVWITPDGTVFRLDRKGINSITNLAYTNYSVLDVEGYGGVRYELPEDAVLVWSPEGGVVRG